MARRQLPDICPLCQIHHTAHSQLLCYQELQTRIQNGVASPQDKRAFQPMVDLMNKHRL